MSHDSTSAVYVGLPLEERELGYSLFRKHISSLAGKESPGVELKCWDEYLPDYDRLIFPAGTIDWTEFLSDLKKCPAMALATGNLAVPALFFVILVEDCPVEVVGELLEANPHALYDTVDDMDFTLLQWIQYTGHHSIAPGILEKIVERDPKAVLSETAGMADISDDEETPLHFFIQRNPHEDELSDQLLAILSASPNAVAFLLLRHLTGAETCPTDLGLVLETATNLERKNKNVFELEVKERYGGDSYDSDEEEPAENTTLMKQLMLDLKSLKKRNVVHRYLKAFIKGRRSQSGQNEEYLDDFFDEKSLACCLLYTLTTLKSRQPEPIEIWGDFVKYHKHGLAKVGENGVTPLFCALRLGHQWPVIQNIIKADTSAVGKLNECHGLLPVQVAALAVENLNSWYGSNDRYAFNAINNTFELLRLKADVVEKSQQPHVEGIKRTAGRTMRKCRPAKKNKKRNKN